MPISPYRGTNQDIERIAESLREAIHKQTSQPVHGRRLLDKIVELTGGTVEMADDPSQQEADGGSLIIEGESDYTIYLSPYTTPLRDNFTIAHELGHFFLHFFLQSLARKFLGASRHTAPVQSNGRPTDLQRPF